MAQVALLEDNTRIAKLCATMLQYAGHQVIVYGHPRECLAALLPSSAIEEGSRAARPVIDVLILDLHLPDISGMEVLRSLRAHPATKSLPLIFCTAAAPPEVTRALQIAPRAFFLEKPFTHQELISAVDIVLGQETF